MIRKNTLMKTYVTGYRPPHLELVLIGLGSCEEWRAFGRLLFLPGVGSLAQVPWGSCVQQTPLDRFRVLPFFDLKVGKIERRNPVKEELGLLTVFEQFVFVPRNLEAELTFYGYRCLWGGNKNSLRPSNEE